MYREFWTISEAGYFKKKEDIFSYVFIVCQILSCICLLIVFLLVLYRCNFHFIPE